MNKDNEVNVINFAKMKEHPIKITFGMFLTLLGIMLVIGEPYMREKLSVHFFTQAQAKEHIEDITDKLTDLEKEQKLTNKAIAKLSTTFDAQNAFNMVRGLEADLVRHLANKQDTQNWREDKTHLESQVTLSHDYKNCVMNSRPNCGLIQQQIFQ